ncbi:MAG: hypothetical protein RMJ98_21325 [Myxococcales bacterium]|nr:hypothetical protein [Polyangiaceae bacterium]MDW8251846.1 hypothetical protein [Myxococcales bacterium]
MATLQCPSPSEDPPDRCSCAPCEAIPRRRYTSPRGASWLLGGVLTLLLMGTTLRVAWHSGQGEDESKLGSNTEPSAIAPTAKPDTQPPAAKLPTEQEEDGPLPAALPFDDYVARKALELRMRGFKCGYRGRAELRVSFAPSGASVRAELLSPRVPAKVAQCIVARLEQTAIPAFRGTEERSVQVSLAMR